MILDRDAVITDGPHSIHDLDSDYNPLRFDVNHLDIPSTPNLPTTQTTDRNHYKQLLSTLIDPRIPLTTPNKIKQATKNITGVIKSAFHLSTSTSTKTASTNPQDLRIQLLLKMKRWGQKTLTKTRHPSFQTLYNLLKRLSKIESIASKFNNGTINYNWIHQLQNSDNSVKHLPKYMVLLRLNHSKAQ